MRLTFIIILTMIAFAANSLLNRAAIEGGWIDPAEFAAIRVLAGAVTLCLILMLRRTPLPLLGPGRLAGVAGLSVYMIGFSAAYTTLDAGLGALILFGTVQIGMFSWSALRGVPPTRYALLGAGIAFAGLCLALWPGPGGVAEPVGAAFMVLAGLGWAAYTLAGRGASDALAATAANFVWTVPAMALLLIGASFELSLEGVALAVIAGAVTSGLGYTLWYTVLPQISTELAAILQLSVPMIALAGGALFLGERPGAIILLAALLVIGGIALAISKSGSKTTGD